MSGQTKIAERRGVRRPSDAVACYEVVGAAAVGSLPVLWVLGAVPWRSPALLIEYMFRGFTACALEDGALNPLVMVCSRAGVPLGMHQLDGGLSYPLGGLLIRLGIEPLAAWKIAVTLLIAPGFGALFWLARRMTGSPVLAAVITALYGLNGTLTARTWNWYWNTVAVALLPVLFLLIYVLFERTTDRRPHALLWPASGVLAAIVVIGIEWQYAGLFAAAAAVCAGVVVLLRSGWTAEQRRALVSGGAVAVVVAFAVARRRLMLAGVHDQFDDIFDTAVNTSIDLVSFVAPDGRASLLGDVLASLGLDGVLVESFADGRQTWVAPYIGVLVPVFFGVVLLARRSTLTPNPRLPPGYLRWLTIVTVASVVLALGPVLHVARVANPDAQVASPLLSLLWTATPLRWIRYPWTWAHLTHVALLLTFAALMPALLRRRRAWSPSVLLLVALLAVEFVSPQVLEAFHSPHPSVPAGGSAAVPRDHPAVTRFESTALPELTAALREIDGEVVMLPWTNGYTVPLLGADAGARLRNVGIDRNIDAVEALAPVASEELRRPTDATVRAMIDRSWATAVVLLDHLPTTGTSIVRFDHQHLDERGAAWLRRVERTEKQLVRAGYCVTAHSWFSIVTSCVK